MNLGTVLVRFEMIPQGKVVLRVLKFLKPPSPDDIVTQKEGELLKKYDRTVMAERPWMSRSLPKFMTPSSLQLLKETYLSRNPAEQSLGARRPRERH